MSKSARLFRVMHLFRCLPAPVTAARMAEDLGVSERTVYRDIESLRVAGARIEGRSGLGYTLSEDIALPPQTLSQLEIEALVLGLSEVQHRGDPALSQAASDALAKITATLPEDKQRHIHHAVGLVHRYQTPAVPSVDMSALREACWQERAIHITYRDRAGVMTERVVWPLAIVYLDRELMLLASCQLRQAYRQFIISSITDFTLLDQSFRPHRVRLLRDYIGELKTRHVIAPACNNGRNAMENGEM